MILECQIYNLSFHKKIIPHSLMQLTKCPFVIIVYLKREELETILNISNTEFISNNLQHKK